MNELRELEMRLDLTVEETAGLRELTTEEAALISGAGGGIGFCELPTGNDHHFIAMMRWAGWSSARIAQAFYR